MTGQIFHIVDVFAEEKYTGNQLAVFMDAASLSSEEMQKLACEAHFSETTFILSDRENNGGYDVRIFTPDEELPFAGHPTLGTAYVIRHESEQFGLEKEQALRASGAFGAGMDVEGSKCPAKPCGY